MTYAPEWTSDRPAGAAAIMQWLSFAAKEVSIGLQLSRLHFIDPDENIDLARAQRDGIRALGILDRVLARRDWLALDRPTIADVAVFPYVALAREGRLDLDAYPHALAWIDRIVGMPGYVPMAGVPEPGS